MELKERSRYISIDPNKKVIKEEQKMKMKRQITYLANLDSNTDPDYTDGFYSSSSETSFEIEDSNPEDVKPKDRISISTNSIQRAKKK